MTDRRGTALMEYGLLAALLAFVIAYGSSMLGDAGRVSLGKLLGVLDGQFTSVLVDPDRPNER